MPRSTRSTRHVSRVAVMAVIATVASSLASIVPSSALAGDRRLEILVVNMTPTPTESGRTCTDAIVRRIRADYTTVSRLGETPLRRLTGHEGETTTFLDWPYADFRAVMERGETHVDSVALVDCRPDERRVDVLVTSPRGVASRIELRDVRVDPTRAAWVADTLLRQAWLGFSP